MSICISLRVNDGIVLAADSALTIDDPKFGIKNVYYNTVKLFELKCDIPAGIMFYGNSDIGGITANNLVCEFLKSYCTSSLRNVEDISNSFVNFLNNKYHSTNSKSRITCTLAGYSPDTFNYDVFNIHTNVNKEACFTKSNSGITWFGQTEIISRLVKGVSLSSRELVFKKYVTQKYMQRNQLNRNNHKDADYLADKLYSRFTKKFEFNLYNELMPLNDAIELVRILADTTTKLDHFINLSNKVVGGPIRIATISNKGFTWIQNQS